MKKLEFKIEIAAVPEKVWKSMLDPATYKQWVNVSWPGSSYEGIWKQDEHIKFSGAQGGGTQAVIKELRKYEFILAEHTAVINADGSLDKESEVAKGWIGTKESYRFNPVENNTELVVEISTPENWAKMFSDGWPAALRELKKICEIG